MANPEHLEILKRRVEEWNEWRKNNPEVRADLSGADLSGADLSGVDLSGANLSGANLSGANLSRANLSRADLYEANLSRANLSRADLLQADLSGADLSKADLIEAHLWRANLIEAYLTGANLIEAYLTGANLSGANLTGANLSGASLIKADLSGADLSRASLVLTNIHGATFNDCKVYGIAVWDLKGEKIEQKNLIITPFDQPQVTVDNIKVAQFIYLLLENKEIRNVLDTLTSKAVLILGRFSEERKNVLDSLKDLLRAKGYLPILFDFEKPASRDLTETIQTLASLSKFVIADITDAKSIPQELSHIVPNYPSIPVKPIILASQREYGMFEHWRNYPWVLETYEYPSLTVLEENLEKEVVGKAEEKLKELKSKKG